MIERAARRKMTVLAVLTVLTVLCAAASALAWWRTCGPGEDSLDNLAVADAAATTAVTDQVGAEVKQILSYDYADLDRTERAASSFLVDEAAAQYRASFAAAKQQAMAQKLVRTTTIGAIGVRELTAEAARLLVFVDQQTLNSVTNQQSSSTAAVDVTARKVDGAWKISAMTAW